MACLRSSHAHATDTAFRTETRHPRARNDLRARTCLRRLQGSESDVRLRCLLGWGQGCSHRRNGIGRCFGEGPAAPVVEPGAAGAAALLVQPAVGVAAPLPGRAVKLREHPGAVVRAARPGRGVRRDSLYKTYRLLCRHGALGRRSRADATAGGRGSRRPAGAAPRPRRPVPPDPLPRRTFRHPPPRPRRRFRTRRVWTRSSKRARIAAAEARAAGGGGGEAGEGGAQGDDRRQGLRARAPGQVVRAEDPRPAPDRRALLLRRPDAAGEQHLPHPPFPPVAGRNAVRARRLPHGPRVRRDGDDSRRVYRRASLGMAARPRRQDEGPGRPRTTAERRRPRAARARARSEPEQPARRRRGALGRRRGRNLSVHRRRLQRRPRQQRRRRGHQLREGLRRAAVLPSLPNRGAARLRQPRRRAGGADRQPQGPHSPQRGAAPRPASRRTGPPVRTRSSSTWHRRPTRPARRRC